MPVHLFDYNIRSNIVLELNTLLGSFSHFTMSATEPNAFVSHAFVIICSNNTYALVARISLVLNGLQSTVYELGVCVSHSFFSFFLSQVMRSTYKQ